MTRGLHRHLLQDAFFIGISVIVAIFLVKSGLLYELMVSLENNHWLASLISGMFFTSAFTTAPAIAAFGELAKFHSPVLIAAWGALGALIGDFVLFKFTTDRLSSDLFSLMRKPYRERLHAIFKLKLFRWSSPFVAAIIIASPLPDELGVMILGFAKAPPRLFALYSFCGNFLGIYLMTVLAQSVV